MQEFEIYAQRVIDGLDLSNAMKERIKQEIVAHLKDEMQRCFSEGLSQSEAQDAAIEHFGKEQIISWLVAQALEHRQARIRRLRTISAIVFAVLLVIISIGVGAWFKVFTDAVAGRDFVRSMPKFAWLVLYFGAGIGCLAILAMVVAKLFHVSRFLAGFCILTVLLVFYASMFLFGSIPLLHETIGTVRAGQSAYTHAVNSFLMRLYLCWLPTIVTGAIIAVLVRRRACIFWLAMSLATGLISAILWGFRLLPHPAPWMYWMKWPTLLSASLLVLVFVMLTGFLARSIAERFGCGKSRAPTKLSQSSQQANEQLQSEHLAEA